MVRMSLQEHDASTLGMELVDGVDRSCMVACSMQTVHACECAYVAVQFHSLAQKDLITLPWIGILLYQQKEAPYLQYNTTRSEIRIVNTTLSVHWTLETPGPVLVIVDKNCTGIYVFGLSIWVHWFLCVSAFIFTLHIWLQLVPSNGSNFAHVDVLLLLVVDPCEVNCHCGWVINALQLLDLPWPWDSLCSFASLRESIACKRSVAPE
jgi:hypothetical protein